MGSHDSKLGKLMIVTWEVDAYNLGSCTSRPEKTKNLRRFTTDYQKKFVPLHPHWLQHAAC